jgi:hypothetical protein
MKTIIRLGGIFFCMLSYYGNAQPPVPAILPEKPALFSDFPETFSISTLAIQKIFTGESTGFIKIPANEYGYLEGYVLEKVRRSSNLISINIRVTNYDGALFTVSKISSQDGKVTYTGRIVHRNYNDVLTLIQTDEKIMMRKEKQSLFLVE